MLVFESLQPDIVVTCDGNTARQVSSVGKYKQTWFSFIKKCQYIKN